MFRKLLFISLIIPMSLMANFTTDVLDAFDGSDPFDFNIEVQYRYEMKSNKIKREYTCKAPDRNCDSQNMHGNGIVNANNFSYLREDHIIEPKLRFGLYKDLEFFISMPTYVSSSRTLGFDNAARDAANDTNADGIVDGNDDKATHNGASNTFWNLRRTGGEDLFLAYRREMKLGTSAVKNTTPNESGYVNPKDLFPEEGISYERAGIKTLNLGFKANLLDNDRDDTDPTWMIAFEYRASISPSPIDFYSAGRLDEMLNGKDLGIYSKAELKSRLSHRIDLANDSIADGVHWMKFQTALSKRYGLSDTVMNFFYEKPLMFSDTAFQKHANREFYMPGAVFGFDLGIEFIPWEKSYRNPQTDEKITTGRFTIDTYFKFTHHNKGMEISEISDFIALPTVVNQYSNLFLNLNLRYMPNRFAQVNFGFAAGYTTDHILTNQARGIDHNNNGKIDTDEEDPNFGTNNLYEKTTFNAINSVGSRILATETFNLKGYFSLQIQF